MSKIKIIAKNASWLSFSQISSNILAFIWTIYIARYLSLTELGTLSYVLAITGFLGIFVDLGLNTYTTKELSKDPSKTNKFLSNIILIKLAFILLLLLFIILILNVHTYSNSMYSK